MIDEIYQTRDRVSYYDIQHRGKSEKRFPNETLYRVFDISSQLSDAIKIKRRNIIVKLHNKLYTYYHVYDFLCLHL